MTYRVFWSPYAEERLERLLRGAADRDILAVAAREIDRQLAADPTAFGESRYETVRVAFLRPLGLQYEVLDDVRTVIVHDVWRINRM